MESRFFSRGFLSPIVHYSTVVWTLFCIVGTWFVILKYDILPRGLIAIGFTFLFAAAIWGGPFIGLLILSLFTDPPEHSRPILTFQELIKQGIRRGSESPGQDG